MSLAELDAEALEELLEDLTDLRHDLGKYITFETRFLEEGAGPEARRAALRKDMHRTREARGEVESAWQLWARLRPVEVAGEPEARRIAAALDELERLDLDGPPEVLDRAQALCAEVAASTRALHGRVRALALDESEQP